MKVGVAFFKLAKRMMEQANTESEFRTVINRCYYGAYRACVHYANSQGVQLTRSRSVHGHVI